jgi:hypothetical protein
MPALTLGEVWRAHGLVDVRDDVRPVLQVDGDLYYVEAHVDNVAAAGAVVAGAGVALEGAVQVAAVQKVIAEVVVAAADALLKIDM